MNLSRLRPALIGAWGAGLALAVYVAVANWAGTDVTAAGITVATVSGLSIGSLYALAAAGIVVVYSTTGTFNFAQGGIGVFCAFSYWQLVENADGPQIPQAAGVALVVLGLAPLIGIGLDVLLMRRLRTAPLVVQLMVTVGLMVFFLTLTAQIWQGDRLRSVDAFWKGSKGVSIGDAVVTWHRLGIIVVAVVIAVLLRLLLFRTRVGVAMRAVVDNRELTALNGARPNVLSGFSWALGSSLAALAGILIAPEITLDPSNLNDKMLVAAIAAAAMGQLKNLPLAVGSGLLIGLLEAHHDQWLQFGNDWRGTRLAIAPILLFLVVLALPQSRLEVGRTKSNLRTIERTTSWWEGLVGAATLVVVAIVFANGWLHFGIWDPGAWSQIALNNGIAALVLALIGLSLVPLTGWAGQVNFAPLAFAGFGAFLFLQLTDGTGSILWVPVVAVLCAPLGAVVALFAARLSGLYLALLSLAFALLMAKLFLVHPKVFPPSSSSQFGSLDVFGFDLDTRYRYFVGLVVVFAVSMMGLILLRNSRFGRRWISLQDSEAAAATIGINVVWTKVIVYATSASIAGMGGVFWAIGRRTVDPAQDFELLVSLEIVLLMAAAGLAMPVAGLFLSFRFVIEAFANRLDQTENVGFLVWILKDFLAKFGPGLLAIGMVVNQRGAIFEMGKGFAPLVPWRRDAREELAVENASKRVPEIGGLGLTEPFTNEAVVALDQSLHIINDVTPSGGYRHGVGQTQVGATDG